MQHGRPDGHWLQWTSLQAMTLLLPTWWSPSSGLGFLQQSKHLIPKHRRYTLNKTKQDKTQEKHIYNLLRINLFCSTRPGFSMKLLPSAALNGSSRRKDSRATELMTPAIVLIQDKWPGCPNRSPTTVLRIPGRRNRLDGRNSSLGSKTCGIKGDVRLKRTSVSLQSWSCWHFFCWRGN